MAGVGRAGATFLPAVADGEPLVGSKRPMVTTTRYPVSDRIIFSVCGLFTMMTVAVFVMLWRM